MKTFLWTTLALVMCLFTACKDDDDNYIPEGPATTFAGKLPTNVGSYTFVYDENNRCIQVKDGSYVYCEIDYDQEILITDEEEASVSFNSNGYITGISAKWNYEEDGSTYKGNGKMSFRYNSDGQLVSSSQYSSESGEEDGVSFSWEGTYESTYTWENGDLIKVTIKETDIEDDEEYESGSTYTIAYDNDKNEVGQNTMVQASVLELEDIDVFSLIGMLGKASIHFPASYTEKWYEKDVDQDYEDEYDYSVNYTLNDDGTIKTEKIGNATPYSYSYTTIAEGDSNARSLSDDSKAKRLIFRSFFTRHRSVK